MPVAATLLFIVAGFWLGFEIKFRLDKLLELVRKQSELP